MSYAKRLTVNKPVEEMSMTELAHNSCYAKDGLARYRDFDTDIDARDFARKLMVEYSLWKEGEDEELVDDDIFDYSMMDNLMCDTSSATGLIALFYRNLWAMADLHARLKSYEDAEEQGLLLESPCKLGDVIFRINKGARNPIIPLVVTEIRHKALSNGKSIIKICSSDDLYTRTNGCLVYYSEEIGKKIFLTKEEAEQALARMEGENEV